MPDTSGEPAGPASRCFIRTLTLRLAIIVTTVVAARQGVVALAGQQVVLSIWNFLALGLDALAIAAQALTGEGAR